MHTMLDITLISGNYVSKRAILSKRVSSNRDWQNGFSDTKRKATKTVNAVIEVFDNRIQ